jgi:hypothetical protein
MPGIGRRAADYGKALSEEAFSVNASVAGELSPPARAVSAVISVSGENARYRIVGTPTNAIGHLLVVGNQVEVYGDQVVSFRIISTSGTDADVFVTYYGN